MLSPVKAPSLSTLPVSQPPPSLHCQHGPAATPRQYTPTQVTCSARRVIIPLATPPSHQPPADLLSEPAEPLHLRDPDRAVPAAVLQPALHHRGVAADQSELSTAPGLHQSQLTW